MWHHLSPSLLLGCFPCGEERQTNERVRPGRAPLLCLALAFWTGYTVVRRVSHCRLFVCAYRLHAPPTFGIFGRWETPHPHRCAKRWKSQQNFEKTGRPPAAAIPAKGSMTGAQRFCAEALKDIENAAGPQTGKKAVKPSIFAFEKNCLLWHF